MKCTRSYRRSAVEVLVVVGRVVEGHDGGLVALQSLFGSACRFQRSPGPMLLMDVLPTVVRAGVQPERNATAHGAETLFGQSFCPRPPSGHSRCLMLTPKVTGTAAHDRVAAVW